MDGAIDKLAKGDQNTPEVGDAPPEYILRVWLEEHPNAIVAAIGPDGKPVPMPDDVPLLPSHEIDDRSFLVLVSPEDTTRVVGAFNDALQRGIAVITINMADDTQVRLHYADVRDAYGVLLRVVVPVDGPGVEALAPRELAASRPRLAVIEKDEVARILAIDEATTILLGWAPEEMAGRPTLEFIHPDDHARAIDNWMEMIARGANHAVRLRFLSKDGGWLWFESSNAIAYRTDGQRYVTGQMIDVSEEMAAVEALRVREEVLRRIAETVPVGLAEIGPDWTVRYANDTLNSLLAEHELDSLEDMFAALGPDDRSALSRAARAAMDDGVDADVDIRLPGAGPTPDRLCRVALRALSAGGQVVGALACLMDVTDLKTQAVTDPLTGLHNRNSIFQVLRSALAGSDPVGVIFLDLDSFKAVNDRFGHEAGDRILTGVGAVVRHTLRDGDAVGRIGGDEFLVVCPNIATAEAALEVAQRLHQVVATHPSEAPLPFASSASVGVAWVAPGSVTAEEAAARADAAMYSAKRRPERGPVLWTESTPAVFQTVSALQH